MQAIGSLRSGRFTRNTIVALGSGLLIGMFIGASAMALTSGDATLQVVPLAGSGIGTSSGPSDARILDEYARYNPESDGALSVPRDQLLAEYDRYNPATETVRAVSAEQLLAEYARYNPEVDASRASALALLLAEYERYNPTGD